MTFANDWRVSVQWGDGDMCEHFEGRRYNERSQRMWSSNTAECAVFAPNGKTAMWPDGDTAKGWMTAEQVAELILAVANGEFNDNERSTS
jgi:hypothetical protein